MSESPRVVVSEFTVSLLAPQNVNFNHYAITVRRHWTREGQTVWGVYSGGFCLGHDGAWEYEPSPGSRTPEYLSTHRWLDQEDALNVAREAVWGIEVNGIPVAAVLQRSSGQAARRAADGVA